MKRKKKDVMITIRSSQVIDGSESDGSELVTQGEYRFNDDSIRFSYMESELTGLEGTLTMFQISPEEAVLSRRGKVNSRMVFRRGETNSFVYRTEFGLLQLGLFTHRMDCAMDEAGGDLRIDYDLSFEESFFSRNSFIINVKEKGLNA